MTHDTTQRPATLPSPPLYAALDHVAVNRTYVQTEGRRDGEIWRRVRRTTGGGGGA